MKVPFALGTLVVASLILYRGPAAADECTVQAVTIEHERNLPAGLLHAVAMVESSYHGRPQPYALRIGGRSIYPTNFDLAARRLRAALEQGRTNINAGCMQLSLEHHGAAFEPVEKILEPPGNIRRAAGLLLAFRREFGGWTAALAHYQGGSEQQRARYICQVWRYLRILAPASASQIDARHCRNKRAPSVSSAVVRQAHDLRRKLSGG